MSTKPTVSAFSPIAPLTLQSYEKYLPTAFDEGLTILQKINKIIKHLDDLGKLSSDVVTKWNEVMEWVLNDGLTADIQTRLDEMVLDGTFDTIINDTLFNELNTKVTQNKGLVDSVQLELTNYKDKVKKFEVSLLDYGFVGDGVTDNLQKFNDLVNAFPNGARVLVPSGNFYISNMNLLVLNIKNFHFVGSVNSQFTFGEVCGDNTNTSPNPALIPKFQNCSFTKITFSAPTALGYAIFTEGSKHLTFEECIIKNVKSHFLQRTDDHIVFNRCKFESDTAFTHMQTIGNVTQHFYVSECEWNFAPNQGSGCLISATRDNRLIGDYWFINNKVFTDQQNGYSIDTFVDLEPESSTVAIRNVHIKDNTVYNAKIWVGGAEVKVEGNYLHYNSFYSLESASGSPITITSSYDTAPVKRIEIKNNIVRCEDHVGYIYKVPIFVEPKANIDTLIIQGNELQANGKLNSGDNNIIHINATGNSIQHLIIKDNEMSYTSIPAVKHGAIYIICYQWSGVRRVDIRGNRLKGVYQPCTAFVHETNGGINYTIDEFIVKDNNIYEVGLAVDKVHLGSPNPKTLLHVVENLTA